MPFYRLYFLDRLGRIGRAEPVEALTDEAACAEAVRLDHGYVVEVWQGARLIQAVRPGGH